MPHPRTVVRAMEGSAVKCPCGAAIRAVDYDSTRSITYVPSERTEAPLTRTCDRGHATVEWVTYDHALEIIAEHQKALAI